MKDKKAMQRVNFLPNLSENIPDGISNKSIEIMYIDCIDNISKESNPFSIKKGVKGVKNASTNIKLEKKKPKQLI